MIILPEDKGFMEALSEAYEQARMRRAQAARDLAYKKLTDDWLQLPTGAKGESDPIPVVSDSDLAETHRQRALILFQAFLHRLAQGDGEAWPDGRIIQEVENFDSSLREAFAIHGSVKKDS